MAKTPRILLSHRLEYLVFRAVEKVLRLFSLPTVFSLGEFIGRIGYRLFPGMRKIVLRNLRTAYRADKTKEELSQLTCDVFERFGANMLTSFRIPFLSDEQILSHITFVNSELVTDPTRTEGIIWVVPHMGNWELLAHTGFLTGTKSQIGTHYRPLNNPLIDRVIKRRRARRGLHLFAKKSSTHKLTKFVRDGGILGILSDQRIRSKGAPAMFFGRPTTCSPMPSLLARRAKGTLVGMSCETSAPCHWTIHMHLIPEATTQACADSLEQAWRRSPADVLWLQERWKLQGTRPLDFLHEYPAGTTPASPLRIVSLLAKETDLGLPPTLAAVEHHQIDLSQNNEMVSRALLKILDEKNPVDTFIVEKIHLKRFKKLAKHSHFLSPKNVISITEGK